MVEETVVQSSSDYSIDRKKNVVYLIGTGLTNATAQRLGTAQMDLPSLMGKTIAAVITDLNEGEHPDDPVVEQLLNELQRKYDHPPNLEELVDLLETAGRQSCTDMASRLSVAFARVLAEESTKLRSDGHANLATVLVDFHQIPDNPENLLGILTTNYDPLIEDAFDALDLTPDLGFQMPHRHSASSAYPLLKLHGSIHWDESVPVRVKQFEDLTAADSPRWISPRRSKVPTAYPFNLIWGRARELLVKADIVRIVGSSLRASDWHISRMLFTTTLLDRASDDTEIEVINRYEDCERMQRDYPLLPIQPIYRIDEVIRYLRTEHGVPWYEDVDDETMAQVKERFENEKNPVDLWLQAKAVQMISEGSSIETESSMFKKYYQNTGGEGETVE